MHHCEEFRERVTEHIIDREDIRANGEFQRELLICSDCADFYAESREMIEALSSVELSISEDQWTALDRRLRMRIINESRPRLHHKGTRSLNLSPVFAAAALLLITIGLYRLAMPLVRAEKPVLPLASGVTYVDHSVPLDPVTVDFLEESELLLRNVMKFAPNDAEDLADAKKIASEQLAEIEQRKEAAADVPPVLSVIDTYETVLRDIRNVGAQSAADDITDIQKRIRKNGLIANMKAFQPNVSLVGFGLN